MSEVLKQSLSPFANFLVKANSKTAIIVGFLASILASSAIEMDKKYNLSDKITNEQDKTFFNYAKSAYQLSCKIATFITFSMATYFLFNRDQFFIYYHSK